MKKHSIIFYLAGIATFAVIGAATYSVVVDSTGLVKFPSDLKVPEPTSTNSVPTKAYVDAHSGGSSGNPATNLLVYGASSQTNSGVNNNSNNIYLGTGTYIQNLYTNGGRYALVNIDHSSGFAWQHQGSTLGYSSGNLTVPGSLGASTGSFLVDTDGSVRVANNAIQFTAEGDIIGSGSVLMDGGLSFDNGSISSGTGILTVGGLIVTNNVILSLQTASSILALNASKQLTNIVYTGVTGSGSLVLSSSALVTNLNTFGLTNNGNINNSGVLTNGGNFFLSGASVGRFLYTTTGGQVSSGTAATSSMLSSVLNDETGSGGVVFSNAPTLLNVNLRTGVTNDGSGFKHARITTGSVNAGASALITNTWTTAFADANYTVQASVSEATTSSASMSVVHIENITSTNVAVRVINNAVGAVTGTIHLIAVHD